MTVDQAHLDYCKANGLDPSGFLAWLQLMETLVPEIYKAVTAMIALFHKQPPAP